MAIIRPIEEAHASNWARRCQRNDTVLRGTMRAEQTRPPRAGPVADRPLPCGAPPRASKSRRASRPRSAPPARNKQSPLRRKHGGTRFSYRGERRTHMHHVMTGVSRISALVGTRSVLAVGLGLSMACSVYAQDVAVSEKSFGCIRDGTKIRNTYIKNADPEKLKEAVRIFKNSVPDREYPIGTFLQLLPDEVMVKHPRQKFPDTNGWEFFHLDLSAQGTKIRNRGVRGGN